MSQPLKALNLKCPDFSENHRGTVLPSLELPQLSPTHLSLPLPLWCFCGWEAVTKGTGCHCHHGDGLRRASQLLRGTINKHQSLVNISPAGTEHSSPAPQRSGPQEMYHGEVVEDKREQEADRMGITAPRREGWWDEWGSRRPEEVRKTSLSFQLSGRKCHILIRVHGVISRNVVFAIIFRYGCGFIRWGPRISVAILMAGPDNT